MAKAKFRMVHTSFWSDGKVSEEMTPEDKFFMLYLLTNEHTTQTGIYQITKKKIAFDMGYSMETVGALMERFINYHKIIAYNADTRELAIVKWGKYNLGRAGKPMEDCVKSELKLVEDVSLIELVGESVESPSLKAIYDTYTLRGTLSGQEEEEEEEEEEELKPSRSKYEICDMENAELLFRMMQDNNPGVKKPNLETWAYDMGLIRRRDNRTDEQIKYLINWTQKDAFWHRNILSPSKLRKQWDQLVLKVKEQKERSEKPQYGQPTKTFRFGGLINEQTTGDNDTRFNGYSLPEQIED